MHIDYSTLVPYAAGFFDGGPRGFTQEDFDLRASFKKKLEDIRNNRFLVEGIGGSAL